MKNLRISYLAVFILITLFPFSSTTAQVNCDSLNYLIRLETPNFFLDSTYIEFGTTGETYIITSFPPQQIANVEWISDHPLECNDCLSNSFTASGDSITIEAIVTLEDGCMVSDGITFYVYLNKDVYFPNAFSPNGDFINDIFRIYAYKAVRQVNFLKIFSRKGHLVYEAYNFEPAPNGHHFGWDGEFRGKKLNNEVYVWKAEIEYINDEIEVRTGTVNLLK